MLPLAKLRPTRQKNWKGRTPTETGLSIKGKAYIAGIYEHPTRHAPDKSIAQLHAEVAKGALEDAGLTHKDVDGYFCAIPPRPAAAPTSSISAMPRRRLPRVSALSLSSHWPASRAPA
jgi:hypothetical protein